MGRDGDPADTGYQRLVAGVELLRAEVALLRSQQYAHVCPSFVPLHIICC